jgi:hypothetical protein
MGVFNTWLGSQREEEMTGLARRGGEWGFGTTAVKSKDEDVRDHISYIQE